MVCNESIAQCSAGGNRPTLFNRGVSLFNTIPLNRTCTDVSIAQHFCVCQHETPLDIHARIAQRAADAAQQAINQALAPYRQCPALAVSAIRSASLIDVNANVTHNNRYHWNTLMEDRNVTDMLRHVRVVFDMRPGNVRALVLTSCTLTVCAGRIRGGS
jgi:hypothetical protein